MIDAPAVNSPTVNGTTQLYLGGTDTAPFDNPRILVEIPSAYGIGFDYSIDSNNQPDFYFTLRVWASGGINRSTGFGGALLTGFRGVIRTGGGIYNYTMYRGNNGDFTSAAIDNLSYGLTQGTGCCLPDAPYCSEDLPQTECDAQGGTFLGGFSACDPRDCNGNGIADNCDIASGPSNDVNANRIPDECEPDCNTNGIPDAWEVSQGMRRDCNGNGLPDDCDITDSTSQDCQPNGIPDECELLTLYAVNAAWGDPVGLFMVNTNDGSQSRFADLDPLFGNAVGLAAHPDTDQLYAVVAADYDVPRYLATIDRATGATTVVGLLSRFLCDIAFRSDGTLYGMTGNNDDITGGEIVIVNTSDASCAGTGIQRDYAQSIAFHPQSGLLYHAATNVLETIDVNTTQVTEITNSLPNNVQALEFDLSGTTLYATLTGGSEYYIIDQTTGEATHVDDFDNFYITGMCFVKGDQNDDGFPDDCDACAGGAASGDTNGDGNVDLDDYADMNECLAGPGGGREPGCECFDFDDDGDIDLSDFSEFQRRFGG